MTLSLTRVDLEAEREQALDLLQRNLPDLDHRRRFSWLYRDNPAGRPLSWFVRDDSTGRVVGMASVIPRPLWVDGKSRRSGQVADFAVDTAYRTLGPALQLQKATLTSVDSGELALCYDCPPHDKGMATFRRLRMTPSCRMARYVRLVRADDVVRNRLPGGRLLRAPVAAAANVALRATDALRPRTKGLTYHVHDGDFGEEFDRLDESLGARAKGVSGGRSAEVLNWRFHDDPLNEYTVVTARRESELEGYAATIEGSRSLVLVDLAATSDESRLGLLDAIAGHARLYGKQSVDALFVNDSRDAEIAARIGYRRRELGAYVVAYAGESALVSPDTRWRFNRLDVMA